jgi:peptidoglycan biosynthesis protein MviN/MurJ (putative lipid II flippase)
VVANVILKLILTPWLGPVGAVLSSSVSWALGSVVFVILLHRAVDLPNTAIRAAAMIPMMFVAVMAARALTGFVPASTTRWNAAVAAAGIGLSSVAIFSVLLVTTQILPWTTLRRSGAAFHAFALARIGARYGV